MTYKIVERLLVPITDGHNTTTSTRPREGWKPPYEPYVPRIQREAALLIQELGEALETASARLKRLETRLPELLTGTQRAEMAIFAGHSADAIDAILSKLKDET